MTASKVFKQNRLTQWEKKLNMSYLQKLWCSFSNLYFSCHLYLFADCSRCRLLLCSLWHVPLRLLFGDVSAGNNNGASAHQSYGSEITLSADSLSPHGPLLFTTLLHLLMMKEIAKIAVNPETSNTSESFSQHTCQVEETCTVPLLTGVCIHWRHGFKYSALWSRSASLFPPVPSRDFYMMIWYTT